MMKIALIIQHGKIGGIEQHVFTLAKELKKNKLTPIVIMLFSGGPMVELFEEENIQYRILNGQHGHDIKIGFKLKEFLKKEKPNIVHMHAVTLIGALTMWLLPNIPLIITEHMAKVGRLIPLKTKLIYKISHARASHIITVSNSTKQSLLEFNPSLKNKILTIYNGIDIISQNRIDLKEELSLNAKFIIGSVGRLDKGKGWHEFIKIATLVNKEIQNCHFIIVGDGPIKQELEELAIQLKIDKHIHFLGFRNDVRAILKSFDLYLLFSEFEACPLSLLEAMTEQVPISGFLPVGGVSEINNNIYPLLTQRSAPNLTQQIIEMLLSKDNNKKMKESAYKRITDNFNVKKMSNKIIKLYTGMVKI